MNRIFRGGVPLRAFAVGALGLLAVAGLGIWGEPSLAQAEGEAAAAPSPELPVHTFTLRNGLTVVVLEQPGVTSFTATFLHRAGVAREWQGLLGAAHLAADAMTAGTTRIGSEGWRKERPLLDELDRLDRALADVRAQRARADEVLAVALDARLKQLQGQLDAAITRHEALMDPRAWGDAYAKIGAEGPRASVGHDALSYSVTLPSTALGSFANLEKERASDGVTRTFYTARRRLMQEWGERGGDAAQPVLEALAHTAWESHPYGRYKGTPEQLAGIDRGELGFFLRTFTAPSRTVLAIVGGVKTAEVKATLERTLGRVPGGNPAAELEGLEAPQRGERRALVTRPGPLELVAGFHVDVDAERDKAALAVLVELLDHPTDGLLSQVQTLAGGGGSVSASLFPVGGPLGPRDPPLLVLGLQPATRALCDAQDALWLSLAVLATDGPPAAALAEARASARARISALWSDHALMAPALAWSTVTAGDPRALLSRYDALEGVSAEQVRDLAATIFDPANRTVVVGAPDEGLLAACGARGQARTR